MQLTSERSEEVRWKAIATIARLLAMGYSETSIQQAMQYRGCDLDASLEWLLDHEMSEFDEEEDVLDTSRVEVDNVEVEVDVPAITHNERWFDYSSDSSDHYHQKGPAQTTTSTPPWRTRTTKAVVASSPNRRKHSSTSSSETAIQQREVIVRRLCALGYSNRVIGEALNETGTEFDAALNWLLDHDDCCIEEEEDDDDDELVGILSKYNRSGPTYPAFESSNTLNPQWKVDDLDLHFNQQPMRVTHQQQRINDSHPRNVDRGEPRYHHNTSKAGDENMSVKEKMRNVFHHSLTTDHLNSQHSNVGSVSGLFNSSTNEYMDSWCKNCSKNVIIESHQEAPSSSGGSTKLGLVRYEYSHLHSSTSKDCFQSLGILFFEITLKLHSFVILWHWRCRLQI